MHDRLYEMKPEAFWALVKKSHKKALEQMYWSLLQAMEHQARSNDLDKADMVQELHHQKIACQMLMADAMGAAVTFERPEDTEAKDKAHNAMMNDTGSEQIDVSDIMQRLGKPKLH